MKPLIEIILKRSWLVILGFIVVTALIMSGAARIKVDTSGQVFQPDHHPILTINDEIKKTFGSNGDSVIGVLEGDIYNPQSLNQIRALTAKLEAIPGTEQVISLTNVGRLEEHDGLIESKDLVSKDDLKPNEIAAVRDYISRNSNSLVSSDGRSTVVISQMKPEAVQQKFGSDVSNLLREGWKGKVALAGKPFILAEINRTIANDLQVVGGVALGLIVVFLFLNFGSWHGVVLPLIQVFFGMNLGLGLYGWIGGTAGSLTTIAIIAILAVGSSFALHLLGRFYSELARGKTKAEALRVTYTQTAQGVMISAVAIVVAMMTLWLSDIATLRDVGTLIIVGVLGSFASAMILMPAIINVLPQPKVRTNPEGAGTPNSFLSRTLSKLADLIYDHKNAMFILAAVLVVFGLVGASRIVPNTSFLSFFPKNSETVRSIQTVDRVFGGSGTINLMLEGDILEPKVLNAILKFGERAKAEIPGVGTAISVATTVETLNGLFSGKHEIPATRQQVSQALLIYQSSVNTAQLTRQVSLNQQQALISIPIPLRDTKNTREFYDQIQVLGNQVFAGVASFKVGGDSLSGLALEDALIHDFIISLSLAIVLVVIVDSFVRSFKAAIITISSLMMTIILQYGLLGWLGINLDISTMLLGALAIGVGDYAIHLTVRFLEERQRGLDAKHALENTLVTSGRSILFTALTLGAAFAALSFSQIQPVASLGQMMVFTVLAVGISSLTLLPAMSLQFLRDPIKKKVLVSSAAD
jgi:uncharacterized protein